jgi:hypothetical protein
LALGKVDLDRCAGRRVHVQLDIAVKRPRRFNGKAFDVLVPDGMIILALAANALAIFDENPVGGKVRLVASDPAPAFKGDQDLFVFFLLYAIKQTERERQTLCQRVIRLKENETSDSIEGKRNEKRTTRMRRNPKRILLLTNNSGYFSRTAASAAEASTWNELLPRKAANEDMMMDDVSTTTTGCRLRSAGFASDRSHFSDFHAESIHQVVFDLTLQRPDSNLCFIRRSLQKCQERARPH